MLKYGPINVLNVKGNVKLGSRLCTRGFGHGKELVELCSSAALEAFGDIGHDRHRSSPDLPRKTQIPGKSPAASDRVDLPSQLSGLLPRNQISEPSYRTHGLTLSLKSLQ